MKIKPRVNTKCLSRQSCWLCKYFCRWLRRCCCFNHFHGGKHYPPFDPAACELFVRLFDTDVCWHLALRSALSRFSASWLVCSAQRLCSRRFRASRRSWSLRSRCSFVSEESLARLCSFITVRFCFKEISKRKLYSQNFNSRKCLRCSLRARGGLLDIQSSKIEMAWTYYPSRRARG